MTSDNFSLVSNVRVRLRETILALLNNVTSADLVFANNEESTFVNYFPVGVRLRIVIGVDHTHASQQSYDALYDRLGENEVSQLAVLPAPIRSSFAILDQRMVIVGFLGSLEVGLYTRGEVRFCSVHRGNDPAIPRFRCLFQMLWNEAKKCSPDAILVAATPEANLQTPRRSPVRAMYLSQSTPREVSVRIRQTTDPSPLPTQFSISTPQRRPTRGRSNSRGGGEEKHRTEHGTAGTA